MASDDAGRALFFVPTDNDVDLAALVMTPQKYPNLSSYTFYDVPFRILTTDSESSKLSTGVPVMAATLLPGFTGAEKNYPIFKAGTFSSKPDETVQVPCPDKINHRAVRAWLISASLQEGASGAPVFGLADRGPGNHKIPVLVGVQSFSWLDQGIVGVTPTKHLVDLMTKTVTGFDVNLNRGVETPTTKGQ